MGQEVANDVQQAWAAFVDRLKYLVKCVEAAVRSGDVEASLTEQLLRLSKTVPPQTGADKNHSLIVDVWKQAFDLWNACVELHNQRNGATDENSIKLRQAACNLLLATEVDDVRCVHMPFVKRLQLFVKTVNTMHTVPLSIHAVPANVFFLFSGHRARFGWRSASSSLLKSVSARRLSLLQSLKKSWASQTTVMTPRARAHPQAFCWSCGSTELSKQIVDNAVPCARSENMH
eukprot:jgi/Chlat1/6671/Chrsp49S06160